MFSTNIYIGKATLFTTTASTPNCLNQQSCTVALRVNYNSGSTVKPSSSGIGMAHALSHLVNKPQYLTGPYLTPPGGSPLAVCDDVHAAPVWGLMTGGVGACDPSSSAPSSVLTAECSDPNIAALGACSPVSLYNLKSNIVAGAGSCVAGTIGISCFPSQSTTPPPSGYASNIDLAAACVYFLEAGYTTTGAGTGTFVQQCQNVSSGTGHIVNPGGSCNISTGAGCIVMYIRTHPPRRAYGTIIADELNYLFGTPAPAGGTVCYGGPPSLACSITPVYFTISQVGGIVFDVTTKADWNLYTSTTSSGEGPSLLYALYDSSFASNLCDPSAVANSGPNNWPLWCDPAFDTQVRAGEFLPGVTFSAFQQAAILGATKGATIPIYSGTNYFVGLNAWNWQQSIGGTRSSLIVVRNRGFEAGAGIWQTLNMRPVPGFVPSNPLYYASGCNPSTGCSQSTLRRGMSQTTFRLSPWTFFTVWEEEFLNQIYDTMLAVDPNTAGQCQTQPGGNAQCIDWMTTGHRSSVNTPLLGQMTWTWNLRNDILFTDGVPVTAHDVCFSILSFRDVPSSLLFSQVSNVVSCSAITDKIAQVVVTGNSVFTELNLGGLYIVPEHIWATVCGGLQAGTDRCVTPSNLASTTVDHVALGDMVGSGPWICNSTQGTSTITGQASCTQNANGSPGGQALAGGAKIVLKRNLGYSRCCDNVQALENGRATTNLQALQWADSDKDGRVTINDIARVASHFGSYDPYFAHPLYSSIPSNHVVDIGDIATVAFYFDDGLTVPFLGTPTAPFTSSPPPLTGIDPNTDPYRLDLGSGNAAYYLATTFSASGATTTLAIIGGTASPTLFTATEDGVTVTGAPGLQGQVVLTFPGLVTGHYTFQMSYAGAANPLITIST